MKTILRVCKSRHYVLADIEKFLKFNGHKGTFFKNGDYFEFKDCSLKIVWKTVGSKIKGLELTMMLIDENVSEQSDVVQTARALVR